MRDDNQRLPQQTSKPSVYAQLQSEQDGSARLTCRKISRTATGIRRKVIGVVDMCVSPDAAYISHPVDGLKRFC
ncbi:MAG: hypothetical protein EA407_02470 [Rhodobacteraceae bacterium]|nr:MAG: hypothetical protein EA407_02470 [Paracoccaceae bacterium]